MVAIFKDKKFRKKLFNLWVPILIQELITALIALLSVFALAASGAPSIAVNGVSYATSVFVIYQNAVLAFTIIGSTLISQYYGRGDIDTIKKVYNFILKVTMFLSLLFFFLSFFIPQNLISIFISGSPETVRYGASYLKIFSFSFLLTGISLPNIMALKNLHLAKYITFSSSIALIIDVVIMNLLLFYFGMGIEGAAIAIVCTRATEAILSSIFLLLKSSVRLNFVYFLKTDKKLLKTIIKLVIPVFVSKIVWSIGSIMASVVLGQIPDSILKNDLISANAAIQNTKSIVCCVSNSFAFATGILLGRELGANRLLLAKKHAQDVSRLALVVGIIDTAIIMLFLPINYIIFGSSAKSPDASNFLLILSITAAVQMVPQSYNTIYTNGLFFTGGDNLVGTLIEVGPYWAIVVVLGVVGVYLNWAPLVIAIIMQIDEIIKWPLTTLNYKRANWLKCIIKKEAIIENNE